MYRGSRLAACFLLVMTGFAATAIALFVIPGAVGDGSARWAIPAALAFAIAHGAAVVGLIRGRDWGRHLAVFVAELGGGLAILGGVALLVGARPFGPDVAAGPGLVAWTVGMYALIGIAAGRVPVLADLSALERGVAYGPRVAGIAFHG